jgi:hypothetical protein
MKIVHYSIIDSAIQQLTNLQACAKVNPRIEQPRPTPSRPGNRSGSLLGNTDRKGVHKHGTKRQTNSHNHAKTEVERDGNYTQNLIVGHRNNSRMMTEILKPHREPPPGKPGRESRPQIKNELDYCRYVL